MILTEEEARKRWCPFVRFEDGFNRGAIDPMNRPEKSDDFVPRCIASDCMAWRFGKSQHGEVVETVSMNKVPVRPGSYEDGWQVGQSKISANDEGGTWERREIVRQGCCGLAGKP